MDSMQDALTNSLTEKGIPVKKNGNGNGKKNGHAANEALSVAAKTIPVPPQKKRFSFKGLNVPNLGTLVQTAEERAQAMAEFNEFKAQISAVMPDYVGQLRQIEAMTDEYERRLNAGAYEQLQQAIAEMLSYGEPAAKDVSVIEYSRAMVATCPEFRGSVEHTLRQLVSVGLLSVSDGVTGRGVRNGEVKVYNKIYCLTNAFVRSADAQTILPAIADLVHRTAEAGKRRFEADLANVKAGAGESPLSVVDFKAGKPGRIALEVPDQVVSVGQVLKGGWLLCESESGKVHVLDAAGYIQRLADEMRESGTFIHADQVGRERLQLAIQLPEEAYRKVSALWKMTSAACKAVEEQQIREAEKAKWVSQVTDERKALDLQATVTAEEFFLAGMPGTLFFDFGFGSVFNWNQKYDSGVDKVEKISDVMALVERDEQGRIRVADCPERLKAFWAGHREFENPGDKFVNLRKLGALLRIGYGLAERDARRAGRVVERVKLAQVTAEMAATVGVDPSTLELEETDEDRAARLSANNIKPQVDAPKLGNSRPAHAGK